MATTTTLQYGVLINRYDGSDMLSGARGWMLWDDKRSAEATAIEIYNEGDGQGAVASTEVIGIATTTTIASVTLAKFGA